MILTPDFGENYGTCKLGAECYCLKGQWRGRDCRNWEPTTAKTYPELQAWQQKTRKEKDG